MTSVGLKNDEIHFLFSESACPLAAEISGLVLGNNIPNGSIAILRHQMEQWQTQLIKQDDG